MEGGNYNTYHDCQKVTTVLSYLKAETNLMAEVILLILIPGSMELNLLFVLQLYV